MLECYFTACWCVKSILHTLSFNINVKFPFSETSIDTPENNGVTGFHMNSLQPPLENNVVNPSTGVLVVSRAQEYQPASTNQDLFDAVFDFFVLDSNTTSNPLQQ